MSVGRQRMSLSSPSWFLMVEGSKVGSTCTLVVAVLLFFGAMATAMGRQMEKEAERESSG